MQPKFRWFDHNSPGTTLRSLEVQNCHELWPDTTGSMVASVYLDKDGKWNGTYWTRGNSALANSLPKCSTFEEIKAVTEMLVLMEV